MLLTRQSEKMAALKRVPIFQGLSGRHLRHIAREAEEVNGPVGKMLARQGDMGREFILILDGRARVEVDGKQIAQLGPGDFFGEMSLIDGKLRAASVIVDTPLVYLVIQWGAFLRLIDRVPGLARKLLVVLCERLRDADARLALMN